MLPKIDRNIIFLFLIKMIRLTKSSDFPFNGICTPNFESIAGAVCFCTDAQFKGECLNLYDDTTFGKCANLKDFGQEFDQGLSSVAVGSGGHCRFWGKSSCSDGGDGFVVGKTKHPEQEVNIYADLRDSPQDGYYNDRWMSFSCWNHSAGRTTIHQ